MRSIVDSKLEAGRCTVGIGASDASFGLTGAFLIHGPCGERLKIISSEGFDDMPWEHVSISTRRRTPNWTEMCFVKNLFWLPEECVMQLHPPESEYVNNHPFCLHLWRPMHVAIPMPPSIMVGIKGATPEQLKGLGFKV